MFHEKIKSLFHSAVDSVMSCISDYVANPDKDFIRSRKLPTDSAFNQQRAKLQPEAVESVFNKFNASVDALDASQVIVTLRQTVLL